MTPPKPNITEYGFIEGSYAYLGMEDGPPITLPQVIEAHNDLADKVNQLVGLVNGLLATTREIRESIKP